jgi:hypothetical protein
MALAVILTGLFIAQFGRRRVIVENIQKPPTG